MARKRINTKVALLGSVVVLVLALIAVITIAYTSRDPESYLEDAERAAQGQAYEDALRYYTRAYELIDDPNQKIDILFDMAQMYRGLDQWPKVMGCWNAVVLEDPNHVRARLALVQAMALEAQAHSKAGVRLAAAWEDLETKTSELLDIATQENLMSLSLGELQEPMLNVAFTAQSEVRLDQYLYRVRGQARLEQAEAGSVAEPSVTLDLAQQDLQQVIETDPQAVEAYALLARVYQERAVLQGAKADVVAQEASLRQAEETLEQATVAAPDVALGHVLLMNFRLERAQKVESGRQTLSLQQLEGPYLQLVSRFGQSPEAYGSLAQFQLVRAYFVPADQRTPFFDKAIAAARQALDLDPDNVERTLALAVMHYRKATMFELAEEFERAVAIARAALSAEATQETTGPLAVQFKLNRLAIYRFLATCATEQILDCGVEQATAAMLSLAQESIHQIEQIRGSGEDLEVAKWRGMLALVSGQRAPGIRELVSVYDKMRASTQSSRADAQLSYALARAFEHTPEQGKALEYFAMALHGGLRFTRPQVMLDYLEVLGRLERWDFVISGANPYGIDTYERLLGGNARSRELRMRALLATNRMGDAEQVLYGLDSQAPETLALRLMLLGARIEQQGQALHTDRQAGMMPWESQRTSSLNDSSANQHLLDQLTDLVRQQVTLVEQLLGLDPERVTSSILARACDHLLEQGEVQRCRSLCETFLAHHQDDVTGLYYLTLLQQDKPEALTSEQRFALQEQAAQSLRDPITRHVELGHYYRRVGRLDEALAEFQQALRQAVQDGQSVQGWDPENDVAAAADVAFEIVLQQEHWSQAEALLENIRKLNVDQCGGMLYDARLALARKDPQRALEKVNLCLEHRPVFSYGMLLRSMIQLALDDAEAAVEDVTLASQWNPTSPGIAEFKVSALRARNQAQGGNPSQQQRNELQRAMEEALRLAPDDMNLLGLYVEEIKEDQPEKAIAIYQAMQQQRPTVQVSLSLGTLATRMALKTVDPSRRQFYLDIASRSLGQAYSLQPSHPDVLEAYATYYRLVGEQDKADALMEQRGKLDVRWMELLMQGRYDQANQVLQQAYQSNPQDPNTLRGLAALAEIYHDLDSLVRYMDELVAIEDTPETRSNQVSVLLKTGLTPVAADRLVQLEQRFPEAPELGMIQAWLALRQGRLRDAEVGLSQFLQEQPLHGMALYLRGQTYLWQERPDEAILDLRQSLLVEARVYTRLALAQAYRDSQRLTAAAEELEGVLSQAGAPPAAAIMLVEVYQQLGNSNALRQLYLNRIQRQGGDIRWLNQLAELDRQQGRLTDAARNFAQAWTVRTSLYGNLEPSQWPSDPDLAQACDGYLQVLLEQGQPERVLSEAETYLKGPYTSLVRLRMAQAQQALGQPDEAYSSLQTALSELQEEADLLQHLVTEATKVLDTDMIGRAIDELVQQAVGTPGAQILSLTWARQQDRDDDAIAIVNQALTQVTDPQERLAWVSLKADVLSRRYERTEEVEWLRQAVSEYQSLLAIMPKNSSVLNNTAYLMALGQIDMPQALAYAQTALEQLPTNPVILDTIGYVVHRMGRQEESLQFLSAARQQFELSGMDVPADVFEHLGMTWAALGQTQAARRAYERALETGDLTLSDSAKQRIQTAIGRLP